MPATRYGLFSAAEYRRPLRALVAVTALSGVLAGWAAVRRGTGDALLIWVELAGVVLLSAAFLRPDRSRRNWLVVAAVSAIVLGATVGVLLLA